MITYEEGPGVPRPCSACLCLIEFSILQKSLKPLQMCSSPQMTPMCVSILSVSHALPKGWFPQHVHMGDKDGRQMGAKRFLPDVFGGNGRRRRLCLYLYRSEGNTCAITHLLRWILGLHGEVYRRCVLQMWSSVSMCF